MDRYTKVVLTVIAVALCVLALENGGIVSARAARGENAIQKVAICDENGRECAYIAGNKLYVLNHDF